MHELAQRSHNSHKKHILSTHTHIQRETKTIAFIRVLRTTAFIRAKNYTVFGRREKAGNKIKITLFTQLALIQYLNQSE